MNSVFFHSQELTADTLLLGACMASQSPACRSLASFQGCWDKKESIGDRWIEMLSPVCESSGLFSASTGAIILRFYFPPKLEASTTHFKSFFAMLLL